MTEGRVVVECADVEVLSGNELHCCISTGRNDCGDYWNSFNVEVLIRPAADTLFVGFDIVDVLVDVDVDVVSRPSVGTLLLMSADEDVVQIQSLLLLLLVGPLRQHFVYWC